MSAVVNAAKLHDTKSMNILVDARLLARGISSGIAEYAAQITDHLLRLDAENRYFVFVNSARSVPLPFPWDKQKNCTTVNWRVPNRLLDLSARFLALPHIDRLIPADLVFSPHFNILRTARAPRIITFHDLSFIHHPDFFEMRQKIWHWRQDYKSQAEGASRIVAVSEFTKHDLVETLGIPAEKISVIYSGINPALKKLPEDDPALVRFRNERGLSFPYFLSLGTLEPRKNVEATIRAFTLLKQKTAFRDYRLIVAGRPGWLYRRILKTAARSGARAHIVFWGEVKTPEKIFLYNSARGFAYPSFFEGFGFPPLEAQACGCPVAVANRTSLPEIVGSSAFLVNPWNVAELAEALEAAAENPRERTRLVQAGFLNAARFRWERAARETLELFHAG